MRRLKLDKGVLKSYLGDKIDGVQSLKYIENNNYLINLTIDSSPESTTLQVFRYEDCSFICTPDREVIHGGLDFFFKSIN